MNESRFLFVLDMIVLNLLDDGRRTYSLYRICVLSATPTATTLTCRNFLNERLRVMMQNHCEEALRLLEMHGCGRSISGHSCQVIHGLLPQTHTIQYNTIQYNTIQYNTIQYNTIQYNTIQYNTIQYNTIQYNTIQHNNTLLSRTGKFILQCSS